MNKNKKNFKRNNHSSHQMNQDQFPSLLSPPQKLYNDLNSHEEYTKHPKDSIEAIEEETSNTRPLSVKAKISTSQYVNSIETIERRDFQQKTILVKSKFLTSKDIINIMDVENLNQNRDFMDSESNNEEEPLNFKNHRVDTMETMEIIETTETTEKPVRNSKNKTKSNIEERKSLNKENSNHNESTNEISRTIVKKAPYNFGQTAIGFYMRELIKKGVYDQFLEETLLKNKAFVERFKNFCLQVSYHTLKDFKEIWSYKEFNDNDYNDFRVALQKITKEFLMKDVHYWIDTKTKQKHSIPLYRKCVALYLKGIEDVDSFDLTEIN